MGNAYYFLGQYEQAREYYQQSLAIFKEIGDKPGEAKALFNVDLCFKKVQ
ncbi:TPR repeat:TPR-related region:TPR-related region [Crocosphaera watsonii WH 0003]|uniref:TPR repeat:TPR-related region:TPR-related region n=2 Tax=Crocosphaera watsonii TaxID=263511 RepID=G5J5E7_CROWT|nr:TPR repeat:TPR-related region:TPR-related region [Crocosphaera watsonii WH 0003]CCQ54054.1 High-affnity carbon uptake protein Hat/HatR [Crocosphaera watsonii WH 0005]